MSEKHFFMNNVLFIRRKNLEIYNVHIPVNSSYEPKYFENLLKDLYCTIAPKDDENHHKKPRK